MRTCRYSHIVRIHKYPKEFFTAKLHTQNDIKEKNKCLYTYMFLEEVLCFQKSCEEKHEVGSSRLTLWHAEQKYRQNLENKNFDELVTYNKYELILILWVSSASQQVIY